MKEQNDDNSADEDDNDEWHDDTYNKQKKQKNYAHMHRVG